MENASDKHDRMVDSWYQDIDQVTGSKPLHEYSIEDLSERGAGIAMEAQQTFVDASMILQAHFLLGEQAGKDATVLKQGDLPEDVRKYLQARIIMSKACKATLAVAYRHKKKDCWLSHHKQNALADVCSVGESNQAADRAGGWQGDCSTSCYRSATCPPAHNASGQVRCPHKLARRGRTTMILLFAVLMMMQISWLAGIGMLLLRMSSGDSAATSYAKQTSFGIGKSGLQYNNSVRYGKEKVDRKAYTRHTLAGEKTRVGKGKTTVRKRVVALALPIMFAALLTSCGGNQPSYCDDLCQLQHEQDLQHARVEMQIEGVVANSVTLLLYSNTGSAMVFATLLAIWIGRRHSLGIHSNDEQRQADRDVDVTRYIAGGNRPIFLPAEEQTIMGDYRELDEEVAMLPPPRPVAPSLAELRRQGFVASPSNFVLGFASSGNLAIDLASAGAIGVIGRPRIGKSTLLRFLIWQARQFGGVVVFDPHGSIVPAGGIAGKVAFANSSLASDELAAKLHVTLQARLALFASGKRDFVPIAVVADEMVKLSLMSSAAINVIGQVVIEGPKVAMYLIMAGQVLPASVLERQGGNGGEAKRRIPGTTYRASIAAQVAFASSSSAATMIGFDGEAAALIADLQQDDKGLAYVAGVCNPTLVAVPDCSLADLDPLPLSLPIVPTLARVEAARVLPAATERDTATLDCPPPLQWALQALQSGATGPRDLQRRSGQSYYACQQACRQLATLGLINQSINQSD